MFVINCGMFTLCQSLNLSYINSYDSLNNSFIIILDRKTLKHQQFKYVAQFYITSKWWKDDSNLSSLGYFLSFLKKGKISIKTLI